jgi:hypothetical protein
MLFTVRLGLFAHLQSALAFNTTDTPLAAVTRGKKLGGSHNRPGRGGEDRNLGDRHESNTVFQQCPSHYTD